MAFLPRSARRKRLQWSLETIDIIPLYKIALWFFALLSVVTDGNTHKIILLWVRVPCTVKEDLGNTGHLGQQPLNIYVYPAWIYSIIQFLRLFWLTEAKKSIPPIVDEFNLSVFKGRIRIGILQEKKICFTKRICDSNQLCTLNNLVCLFTSQLILQLFCII